LALPNGIVVSGPFSHVNGVSVNGVVELAAEDSPANPVNVSARGRVDGQTESFVIGFVIAGTLMKDVLIRAPGPSLAQFGVKSQPQQTLLSVYRGTELVSSATPGVQSATRPYFEPDNVAAAASKVGAFPLTTRGFDEAECLLSLPPGGYTVVISAPDGQRGEVLGEVYFP